MNTAQKAQTNTMSSGNTSRRSTKIPESPRLRLLKMLATMTRRKRSRKRSRKKKEKMRMKMRIMR